VTGLEVLGDTVQDFALIPLDCPAPAIQSVLLETSGMTVTFSAQVTTTYPVEYLWDFGDGMTSSLASPVHAYSRMGFYPVTLLVSNACGVASWEDSVSLGGRIFLPVIVRP
jgi:hypothetical protein